MPAKQTRAYTCTHACHTGAAEEQEDGCQKVDEQLLRLEVANSVASKYEAYVCPVSFDLMQVCVCVCV